MSDGFVTERYLHLRRAAFLMCGDWALADDLARTTLARVLTELDVTDPELWSYADLMSAFKKPRGRREHVFVAPSDPATSTGGDLHTVLVLDALHGLHPRCRAVLVLRHFCGLAIDETADALDLDDSRVLAFEAEGLGAFESLLNAARTAGVR
ncbi:ECF subfamily RNA polymerase sigma-24 subunit [Actinoplanes friuliensis]|jgi:DNA-directed RNA polymerase specialized sigma24 family protein|uniref:ECF subfamily RNA polymerase sigma-24 subunit n=1 Tax=Actinoplanes friuliensis DSM 7358 TaxID=1246995 RepID=U5VSS0_9ACTN|nr:ECF subfamily RNA polymerase sigma-24 subunit [Actinoplanes friuliensis]AGZ40033.1 ECF subfamily RNA polymerase sigma-24 subunit [Actinoplanes friuliensis DSM 7358]